MKVEITCVGCGVEAALPVEKTLPLCASCAKSAKKSSRGVSRTKKPPKPEGVKPEIKG